MAGKITQVVETQFKSAGAQKIVKDTEQIGRAQTRLGQASASAGRQFSAQASGLGGLVAAYAGAAATIFALTAAFDALNKSARAEQTITGVNALASAIGESGPKILKSLQEITKGQLSVVQTAELANLALSSGFSTKQIEQLASISLKASRALGRDLTDSFNRLVRGVTKLEPELLDELGIFTRLDPAVEAYARQLGKTVGALSNFERRQAFANAVAKEGEEKFRDIDTSAATSAESLEKLAATISNLGIKVGAFIAQALQPLVDALSAPVTAIGTFGILTRLVFGKTLDEAKGGVAAFSDKIDKFSSSIVDKFGTASSKSKAAVAQLGAELDKTSLAVARASQANDQEFKSLIAKGRAQELSYNQTRRLIAITEQEIAANKKKINNLEALEKRTKGQEKQIEVLNRRNAEFTKIQEGANNRIKNTGSFALTASKGVRVFGNAFVAAGRGILGVLSLLTTLITVFSVIISVGSVILNAFGWLEPVTDFVKGLVREFRIFLGLQSEVIKQGKVLNALFDKTTFNDITVQAQSAFTGSAITAQISGDDIAAAVKKTVAQGATRTAEEFAQAASRNLPASIRRAFLNRTDNVVAVREAFEAIFRDAFQGREGIGPGALQGINAYAEAAGITLSSALKQLDISDGGLFIKEIENSAGALADIKAEFIDTQNLSGQLLTDAEKFNATQVEILQTQKVQANLQELITSGAGNAEQIERRRQAVVAKIANLLSDAAKATGDARQELLNTANAAQLTLDITDKQVGAQLRILEEREKILKTFNKEIKAAEELNDIFSLITENGNLRAKIVVDDEKRRRVQISQLVESFNLGKELLAQEREGAKLQEDQAQLASLARDAEKAIVGLFVETVKQSRALLENLEKIELKESNRKRNLQDQLELFKAQRAVVEATQKAQDVNIAVERQKKLIDLQNNLNKARRKGDLLALEADQSLRESNADRFFRTAQDARELQITFQEEQVAELRKFTAEQAKLIEDKARLDTLNLQKQIEIFAQLPEKIKTQFDAQKKLDNDAIEGRRKVAIAEFDLLEARKQDLVAQAQSFENHITGIAEVLANDIVSRKQLLEGTDFIDNTRKLLREAGRDATAITDTASARRARLAMESSPAQTEVLSALADITTRLTATNFDSVKKTINEAFDAEVALANARREGAEADKLRDAEQKLTALRDKLVEVGITADTNIQELFNTLNSKIYETQSAINANTIASDNLTVAMKESGGIVSNQLSGAFMTLNNALIDGSITMGMVGNTFRDMLGNMLREVQQAVFKKTLADPIANFITGSLGFGGKGIPAGGGGFIPGTFPATGISLPASGGLMHLAQGGNPNAATMKRDRIPALLEPGEFVMRKDAVKQFGVNTMMKMNAAPRRGFAGGGRVDSGGSPAIDKRAQDYMRGGFMSPAEAYAQAAIDFGAGSSSSMRGTPSMTTPSVSGNQALDAIRGALGQGTPAPVGQSFIGRSMSGMAVPTSKPSRAKSIGDMIDEGLMDFGRAFTGKAKSIEDSIKGGMSIDLAPLMESFGIGPQSSLAPTTGGIMNVGLFDSLTGNQSKSKQKSLKDRFKGTSPRTKPQGVGSFFKGVYNSVADAVGLNTIATAGQSVKGFYDGASMIDDQGNIIGGAPTASTATKTSSSSGLLSESTLALANSLIGVEGLTADQALEVASYYAGSRAGYDPRGNLAGALGATGVQLDMGAIPFVGSVVNLGRMISGNPNLGRFQVSPKSIPTARQAATRVEVFNRTGVMATGNKLGFMEGDVTPSGNFMAAGKGGVVSGVDPFVGDKLGLDIATSRAIGNSFRASGTGVEFSTIGDFITAFTTPGRQSRLTVEEYNAMSAQGRAGYSPALGGGRALSNYQQAQLSIYGGYTNNLGQTTIPGGRFSGTVADLTRGSFSDNFVSGIASGFSSDPGGGGGYGGVAGGSMGGISASGSDAFDALGSDDFAGFAEEASGGLVRKMAAGGAVMSRDRVPALLEPGEFVIRRPMAKAIGGAALNQMNATGKGMKAPNIQVNLSNEGAPKNVQAAAPRVSGDKIIIDMITRDMRNNGPIKKSLRK